MFPKMFLVLERSHLSKKHALIMQLAFLLWLSQSIFKNI